MSRRRPALSRDSASPGWPPAPTAPPGCALCGRVTPVLTEHHLIPRSQGRRQGVRLADLPVALLCPACHKFLHAQFSNAQLARELSAIDRLLAQDNVQRFVAWVRKQPVTKGVRVR